MMNAAIIPFRDDIDILTYSTEPFFIGFRYAWLRSSR